MKIIAFAALLALVAAPVGCGGGGGDPPKVALLLPERRAPHYEDHDRPEFEARVASLCAGCEIVYRNAHGSAARQRTQVEEALGEGAGVLVLDPVDATAIAPAVERADREGVPVVSYDRLALGAPVAYYVSFDGVEAGELQAEALARKLRRGGDARGPIVMIDGPRGDPEAGRLAEGARRVFADEGVEVARSYDASGWSPGGAERETELAVRALGRDGFAAVYAADDGIAGGVVAALKALGIAPASRPITGGGAELRALHRILLDEQLMTVYRPTGPEANAAALIAVALARGGKVRAGLVTGGTDNGRVDVPSVLLSPVAVGKGNVTITIVKDEFWKVSEMCSGRFKKICRRDSVD